MKRNAIKGSQAPLPDEFSSNKEHHVDFTSPETSLNIDVRHDDSEYFEFELFKIFKIKSKRVTRNVIVLIALIVLAILIAIVIK